jgi:undecaprenyl-diphosphatase
MILKNVSLKIIGWILLLAIVFLTIVFFYQKPFIAAPDEWIMKNVSTLHQSGWNRFFIGLTNFASRSYQYAILIFFSILWLLLEKRWEEPFILAFCLIGVRYGNAWLKGTFDRDRPAFDQMIEISGYSLPSGHAMINMAFFGLLAYLVIGYSSMIQPYKSYVYGITGLFLLLVGFSRVYLGVHYPTDVLAGFLAGGTWMLVCILLYQFLASKRKESGSKP